MSTLNIIGKLAVAGKLTITNVFLLMWGETNEVWGSTNRIWRA